jgi:hypothetical protein
MQVPTEQELAAARAASAQLDADVRKAGLGLLIVAALPAFLAVMAFFLDDSESLWRMKLYGAIGAVVIAGMGGLILARQWWALHVCAAVTVALAGALAYVAISDEKWQGLLLAGGIATALPFFLRVGEGLRARRRRR